MIPTTCSSPSRVHQHGIGKVLDDGAASCVTVHGVVLIPLTVNRIRMCTHIRAPSTTKRRTLLGNKKVSLLATHW